MGAVLGEISCFLAPFEPFEHEQDLFSHSFLLTMLRANHNHNNNNSNNSMRRLIDLHVVFLAAIFLNGRTAQAMLLPNSRFCASPLFSQPPINNHESSSSASSSSTVISSLDDAVHNRYACTRFQRSDGRNDTVTTAPSQSDMAIVQTAYECLDLSRRAPTGFNIQPYKLLLVYSKEQKEKMARYCVGHNAHRVRDSECTAIFLADRQVVQELNQYRTLLGGPTKWKGLKWFKVQILIAMFSSGFPFPKWISGPISWAFRVGMRVVSWITRAWLPVPTLSSSETWSQKNTMLVAMTYMLACTSRSVATCPMEGYLAWGIRQSLNIPRRYTIPLIVATGKPYIRSNSKTMDDAGFTHGLSKDMATPRFPKEQMIFGDVFGQEIITELL
jgi:nitroreductase